MDSTRIRHIKEKNGIVSFNEINQKQFNDLVSNFSFLDKDSVKTIINSIVNVNIYISAYCDALNRKMEINDKIKREEFGNQMKLLASVVTLIDSKETKNKIIDSLIDHSKWIREKVHEDNKLKIKLISLGMGCAFLFMKTFLDVNIKENKKSNTLKNAGLERNM